MEPKEREAGKLNPFALPPETDARFILRKGSHPFSPHTDPRFAQELAILSAQASLQAVPVIELGQTLAAQDGQAFGVGPKKSLYLDGGLRILLRKSVENFRAIVRHELTHIVNRDIGRTYFAQSLWVAVVIVGILPLLVSANYLIISSTYLKFADGFTSDDLRRIVFINLPTFARLLLQSVGLVLLVLLIRAGLLRTREVYADWRAALWGSAPALASIFEAQSRRRKSGFNPFRLHPSPEERLDTLNRPRGLFELHFDVPFVVGVFTSLVLDGLIPIVITSVITVGPGIIGLTAALIEQARLRANGAVLALRPLIYGLDALFIGFAFLMVILPFLILAPLAAATLGLQVQRQSLADLASGRTGIQHYLRLALPAVWMGLGMVVGMLLSPVSILLPVSFGGAVLGLLCLVIFVFFNWLALVYARFFSRRLLGSHAKFTPPVGKSRLLTALVAALFLVVELPLIAGYFMMTQTTSIGTLQVLLILVGIMLGMLVLMGSTFVFHWIVFRLYRRFRPVRCPSCGSVSSDVAVVQKDCQRCGKSMVPWLYVTG